MVASVTVVVSRVLRARRHPAATAVIVALLSISLITRVADHRAAGCPRSRANSSAFQAATTLVPDDATSSSSKETANDGTLLRAWTGCAGNE